MTRDQLIAWRKRKKRTRAITIAGGAAAAALVVAFAIVPAIRRSVNARKAASVPDPVEEETQSVSTDTAERTAPSDGRSGNTGWNLDSTGWWFLNEDGTVFTSGWKTISGQRYYFKSDGYMATGWVNTGNIKDDYFGADGVYDPTVTQKLIALTFDDGPSKNTDTILDALEANGAKATFFVVGQQAEYYQSELQREVNEGMEVGSHTYEHMTLKGATPDAIVETLAKNDQTISSIAGITPEIMRPTGGGVDLNVVENVDKPMILWNIDTEDWRTKDAANTISVATSQASDGSIILCHDLYEATAEAAQTIIPQLVQSGYKLVTVSELAEAYGYTLEVGGEYFDFKPNGEAYYRTKQQQIDMLTSGESVDGN